MNETDIIVENLFYAVPVIHKKLMKINPPDIDCGIRLSRLHIGILAMLSENSAPISEIAGAFFIPNSQMTYLIERMVRAGLVVRTTNIRDRRVKDIALSARGREVFRQCDRYLKENVKKMLSALSEKELAELSESLLKLREIGPRLGSHQK
ncbi:MAG: MarR family transcriptional regulator [Dehalococcoidales bacterium]|nr:MarR family transcriptional regulator [Dehalococcoidales bacterium]